LNHRDYIVVILLGAFALGLVLVLSGCSAFEDSRGLNAGCDLVCKDCGEIKLNCKQQLELDTNSESAGTVGKTLTIGK